MEAVEAHDWSWSSFESFNDGKKVRNVSVWPDEIIAIKGKGDSLAEAFVDAYLKALDDSIKLGELK